MVSDSIRKDCRALPIPLPALDGTTDRLRQQKCRSFMDASSERSCESGCVEGGLYKTKCFKGLLVFFIRYVLRYVLHANESHLLGIYRNVPNVVGFIVDLREFSTYMAWVD